MQLSKPLPSRAHVPYSPDTFVPPLHPGLFLRFLFPLSSGKLEISSPRNNFATTGRTTTRAPRRLRRSKGSTWQDEGRRNISLRSEFREILLFDLTNGVDVHADDDQSGIRISVQLRVTLCPEIHLVPIFRRCIIHTRCMFFSINASFPAEPLRGETLQDRGQQRRKVSVR